jgi:hypothetical protein
VCAGYSPLISARSAFLESLLRRRAHCGDLRYENIINMHLLKITCGWWEMLDR